MEQVRHVGVGGAEELPTVSPVVRPKIVGSCGVVEREEND